MNYLIGISGKAGHGKDSVAKAIEQCFIDDGTKMEILTIKFADKLKDITAELLDINEFFMEDQVAKNKELHHMGGITARKALQFMGTEIGRNIYEDIWVYHYLKDVGRFFALSNMAANCICLTTDVRFENEYKAIKNYKSKLWKVKKVLVRVVRPGFSYDIDNNHPSETGLDHIDDWDYKIIANNMAELVEETKKVYKLIKS
jgi:hypothetical protein